MNLDFHHKRVILYILVLKSDLVTKFLVSISILVDRCWRTFKSRRVGLGYKGLADVTFVFSVVTLVQYGQRDPPAGERPLQDVVPL